MKHAIARALRAVSGADVSIEPFIFGGHVQRNDVRVVAHAHCCLPPLELDVSICSATNRKRPAATGAAATDTPDDVAAGIQHSLTARLRDKRARQRDLHAFVPFIVSAGGVFLSETEKAVAMWRQHVPTSEHGFMINRLSCALLRRRVLPVKTA